MPKVKTVKARTPKKVMDMIRKNSGIHLDLGCGPGVKPPWTGMDIRNFPNVDIIHDIEEIPYPLPDECCLSVLMSHVAEHIDPRKFNFIKVIDEVWRIMKPSARLMIACPYAGSVRMNRDPSGHVNNINQETFWYFDPTHISGLYYIYQPKPFKIIANAWQSQGDLEIVLEKMPLPVGYVCGYA